MEHTKTEVAVTCIFLFRVENCDYKLKVCLNEKLIHETGAESRKKMDRRTSQKLSQKYEWRHR